MVAITSALASSHPGGSSTRSSPELDAKARTCRAQLADWVTCPSAKTPGGKAKIAEISARLESIQHEIKTSDAPRAPTGELVDYRSSPGRVGAHVDAYA